jgi:hypothetical protein
VILITGMQISPQLLAIMTAFELREQEGYPSNITQPSPNQRLLEGREDDTKELNDQKVLEVFDEATHPVISSINSCTQ